VSIDIVMNKEQWFGKICSPSTWWYCIFLSFFWKYWGKSRKISKYLQNTSLDCSLGILLSCCDWKL